MSELDYKVANATKWSAITEVMAKLVAPISTMLLARILTPEAFGAVATISMIIAFAELFADAGFQRYIIQHEFKDDEEKYRSTNVAFWTNLALSLLLWFVIAVFRNQLAALVGSPELGLGLTVACVNIPIVAFSSLQTALYKRDFDFRFLFFSRIISIAIPLLVTVPLALFFRNYWALILGTIATNVATAVLLSCKSKWKPTMYYSFPLLKEMFAFCGWVLLDSILLWMTSYLDIFFVGNKLGEYYLGLFKTSMSTVGQFTSVITSITLPVLIPALSRLQDNVPAMRDMLLKMQKYTAILLLPIGFGIFLYSDLITEILLGHQWLEAAPFIGLWALADVIVVVFSRFCSCVYPSVGKPKLSVISQLQYLCVFLPAVVISTNYDFQVVYIVRSLIRFEGVAFNLIVIYILIHQSTLKMLRNILPELVACIGMCVVAFFLAMIDSGILWQLFSIAICAIVYFLILYIIPEERNAITGVIKLIRKK